MADDGTCQVYVNDMDGGGASPHIGPFEADIGTVTIKRETGGTVTFTGHGGSGHDDNRDCMTALGSWVIRSSAAKRSTSSRWILDERCGAAAHRAVGGHASTRRAARSGTSSGKVDLTVFGFDEHATQTSSILCGVPDTGKYKISGVLTGLLAASPYIG